tara:strand:- start:137 stop:241 length:105 start_codon:yes stop_codon:yes gene_type:complete
LTTGLAAAGFFSALAGAGGAAATTGVAATGPPAF